MFPRSPSRSILTALAVLLSVSLAVSCGSDDPAEPVGGGSGSVTKTIGAGGGTISSKGVSIEFPPGAFPGDSEVTLTPKKTTEIPPGLSGPDPTGAVEVSSTLLPVQSAKVSVNSAGLANRIPRSSGATADIVSSMGYIGVSIADLGGMLPGLVTVVDENGNSVLEGLLDIPSPETQAPSAGSPALSVTLVFGTIPGVTIIYRGIPSVLDDGVPFSAGIEIQATDQSPVSTETLDWANLTDANGPIIYGGKTQTLPFSSFLAAGQAKTVSVNTEDYFCIGDGSDTVTMGCFFLGDFGISFGTFAHIINVSVACTNTPQ